MKMNSMAWMRVSTVDMPTAQKPKQLEMIYSQKNHNKELQLYGY